MQWEVLNVTTNCVMVGQKISYLKSRAAGLGKYLNLTEDLFAPS